MRPWWLYNLGLTFFPVFHLVDTIIVECEACGREHHYRFDIDGVPHIRQGFRRRFVQDPKTTVDIHMGAVSEFQLTAMRKGLRGLRF